MNSILITNIQRLCVSDGPGVRTVVFLKGCSLRCPWCCNPETIYKNEDLYYDNFQCIKDSNSPICSNCELTGGVNFKTDCPINAYENTFSIYSSKQLIQVFKKDIDSPFCDGITFSGGEPLLQFNALEEVLEYLKSKNITIAVETSLHVPIHYLKIAVKYVDFWIVDLKLQRPHFNYNLDEENAFRDNLKYLQTIVASQQVQYRMVIIKEITNDYEHIVSELQQLHVENIELLPVHNLAETKYKKLHRKFQQFEEPTQNDMKLLCEKLNVKGINTIFEY